MSYKDLWLSIITDLSDEIGRANVITWYKDTAILNIDESGVMTVGLPLVFFLDWHKKHYQQTTLQIAQKHMARITALEYQIEGKLSQKDERVMDLLKHFPEKTGRKLPNQPLVKLKNGLKSQLLNARYSLDNFIVSPETRLVHAACMAVAQRPGETHCNPLFIYGGVGLGKTHLAQATAREVLRNDPTKVILVANMEMFANEMIEAIQSKTMKTFRDKYRKVDVFIIDDVQFVVNKGKTEEEFFHTFNYLYESGKQIIITSDRSPQELSLVSDRLVSRFQSGMTAQIRMPNAETRLAILQSKCREAQVFIQDQVLELVATHMEQSVRSMLGVLNQLIAKYEFEHEAATLKSAAALIELNQKGAKPTPFLSPQNRESSVTIQELLDSVSRYYTISQEEITGTSRHREVMLPRQVIMFLAKTKLNLSLNHIGRTMGNRNHTTVMNAVDRIKKSLNSIVSSFVISMQLQRKLEWLNGQRLQ
ncbi:chromosomal replication initiator protein DnaA [Candidatus Peregrinibacteria bacterium]|nr:MAG: chromosomal replication initiator protein DnaA [Candidatus Peregrinibacteria bacterium]